MASPPNASPPAGSPPYPPHAQLPSKKRPSGNDLTVAPPSLKRRKASTLSVASAGSAHPLRQTSFPPDEQSPHGGYSPSYPRSPGDDATSFVSGSHVSGAPAKKKRGRKSKAERAREQAEALRDGTPSMVGGRAGTAMSAASGNLGRDGDADGAKEGDNDGSFEIPENMASTSAARSKEQLEEEKELLALLKSKMDPIQFDRYEVWHRAFLKPADVKRHINSVTSQSCPQTVHQMMQVVCKMYLGDIVESAREVQQELIDLGEKQTDLPDDDLEPKNELSEFRRRAPLRPDHLREAYRRRKASAENGGALGSLLTWNQQTHNGVERFAVRAGGRRIFR